MRYLVSGRDHSGRALEWTVEVEVEEQAGGGEPRYRVHAGGKGYDVTWTPLLGATHWALRLDGGRQTVVVEPEGAGLSLAVAADRFDLEVRPALPGTGRRAGGTAAARIVEVRAPMPGLLVGVDVEPGQKVSAGTSLGVIEAMKMQMEIRAPAAGTVREVRVAPGREVGAGEVIIVLGDGSMSDDGDGSDE